MTGSDIVVGAVSPSSLQRHANRMQLVRIHDSHQLVVKQTISDCHRQFIYRWKELEHNLPVLAGKSYRVVLFPYILCTLF